MISWINPHRSLQGKPGSRLRILASPGVLLALIFILGLVLRVWYYSNKPCLSRDSTSYIKWATSNELAGNIRSGFWRMPYIAFLRAVHSAGGNVESVAIATNILCGALTAVVVVLIGRRGKIPGAEWAGFFTAVNFRLIDWCTEAQRETLYILFVLLAFYCFFAYIDRGRLKDLLLIVFFGFLGFLMRVDVLPSMFAITICSLLIMWRKKHPHFRRDLVLASIFTLLLLGAYYFAACRYLDIRPDRQLMKILHNQRWFRR